MMFNDISATFNTLIIFFFFSFTQPANLLPIAYIDVLHHVFRDRAGGGDPNLIYDAWNDSGVLKKNQNVWAILMIDHCHIY